MKDWRTPRRPEESVAGDPGQAISRRRSGQVLAFATVIFVTFIGLFARYQILGPLQADRFIEPAFYQRYRGVPVALSRGNIVDRYGVPLHYPVWGSAIVRFPSSPESAENGPQKILRDPDEETLSAALDGSMGDDVSVVPEETRYGPESIARHVIGHVRTNAYMNPADNVGESGLEKWFQSSLAGGYPASAGTVLTGEGGDMPGVGVTIAPSQAVPPNLWTTLDASVQRIVEDALDEREITRGAVVVLDVATGEILAMASRPNFDQNHPEKSLDDPDSPFVNRAVSAFAPGSVWKPVVAALALERGYVSEETTFVCEGSLKVGDRTISCGSTEKGHGVVTVREAVALSCNSAMIQVALKIPGSELVEFAKAAHFGRRTGIELPDEAAGALPDPWSMYSGDKANFAIGQGYLSVTPLQVAAFFRAVAAGGVWIDPILIRGREQDSVRLFSEKTAQILQSSLLLATREGTGREAYLPGLGSAGKTGTAETGVSAGVTHAWFCGWAPVIAPKYVIAVFAEEAGDGPTLAAPLFHDIAEDILPR